MKKGKIIFAVAAVLVVAVLAAGCMGNPGAMYMSRISDLEARVESLEGQVYDLQDELYYYDYGTEDGTEAWTEPSMEPLPAPSELAPADYAGMLETLGEKVQTVTQEAAQAAVPATYEERMSVYLGWKAEFKSVEREIDAAEDQLEMDYTAGRVTREEYRAYERQFDEMDDQLDTAKDQLELRMGVDD